MTRELNFTKSITIYPDSWKEVKLKDIAEIRGGLAFDPTKFKNQGRFQVIRMSNLYENVLNLDRSNCFLDELSEKEKDYLLNTGDILITLTGTIGKRDYGYSFQITNEKELLLNQRIAKIQVYNADYRYVNYAIKTKKFLNNFFFTSRGGTGNQANVGTQDLSNLKIPLPPLPEQKAIADILTTWDEAITMTQDLIKKLEQRNKGLMQALLTGKKRLKGFEGEWTKKYIFEIAIEVSIRNKTDKQLTVLSCTKYDGLVPSLEYFGRRVFGSDTSTYKIVPNGCFAYATNHIEEGSIGYQDFLDEALISPMYTVFKTNKSVNNNYLYKVLKSHHYIHEYQKRMEGSIDRRGGLRWDDFSKIPVYLPSYEEQSAINSVISKANNELKLLNTQLVSLKQQKKGLMQKLLTGEIRVKTANKEE